MEVRALVARRLDGVDAIELVETPDPQPGPAQVRIAVAAAAWLYLLFLAVWGLNYRRVPLEQKLDYDQSRLTREAAIEFTNAAVAEVNAFGDLLPNLLLDGRDTYDLQLEAVMGGVAA